jgi:Flp pilus assembly protein TadD
VSRTLWQIAALSLCLAAPAAAVAGALEEAKAMVESGRDLLKTAEKARGTKKGPAYAEGLKKYARAYMLITNKQLRNDAPDLLAEIGEQIAKANREPEVIAMRQGLLAEAIEASTSGDYTKAYDALSKLRDLDPREWTVDYALGVISERMEGG